MNFLRRKAGVLFLAGACLLVSLGLAYAVGPAGSESVVVLVAIPAWFLGLFWKKVIPVALLAPFFGIAGGVALLVCEPDTEWITVLAILGSLGGLFSLFAGLLGVVLGCAEAPERKQRRVSAVAYGKLGESLICQIGIDRSDVAGAQ